MLTLLNPGNAAQAAGHAVLRRPRLDLWARIAARSGFQRMRTSRAWQDKEETPPLNTPQLLRGHRQAMLAAAATVTTAGLEPICNSSLVQDSPYNNSNTLARINFHKQNDLDAVY